MSDISSWVAILSHPEGFKAHCQTVLSPSHILSCKGSTADFLNFPPSTYPRAKEFGFVTLSQQKCMAGYTVNLHSSKEKGEYLFHG